MKNNKIFDDYKTRSYLSAIEAAKILGIPVNLLHNLAKEKKIPFFKSASGQYRFILKELKKYEKKYGGIKKENKLIFDRINKFIVNNTYQNIFIKNSQKMDEIKNDSIHLMITSPPYFNTKMYSKNPQKNDLGNIHDLDKWLSEMQKVWKEVFRVLQPGRKAFINIMNLPIRLEKSFKTLNLTGKTIDGCENIGFIFKRDIVWQKTNSVRAHFGSYPFPGGILINHAHEYILEFDKPAKSSSKKYAHLTKEQKELSKLDKEFWTEIKKSDVWKMKPEISGDKRNHAAPFPYELPFRLIKAFSFVGEIILDPFLGSGTTLVVARNLKRNGIGYEINPDIASDAIIRIDSFQENLFGEII